MEMTSRSQIRRIRSQMECKHDLAERDTAMVDGMCPICLLVRIKELEAKLARHDKSTYEMVHKKYLASLHEKIEALESELEHERRKHLTDGVLIIDKEGIISK